MVRLGITKRSPSTKSSNQRCSGIMRWVAGSKSAMAQSWLRLALRRIAGALARQRNKRASSFRGEAKPRTRNLEIPPCAIAHLGFALCAPRDDSVERLRDLKNDS